MIGRNVLELPFSFPLIIFPDEYLLITKELNTFHTLRGTVEMHKYFIITNFLYQKFSIQQGQCIIIIV